MYKIAVIGDKNSVMGFASLGLAVFYADSEASVREVFLKLDLSKYGIIYITEKAASLIPDIIEKYRFESIPAIILIPGANSNTGAGLADVTKSVEKAVGSIILK